MDTSIINLFAVTILFMLNLECCFASEVNYVEHNQTMRIPLMRQKMPLEQQLNSPLAKHGITMDWLYQKNLKGGNGTNDSIPIYRYLDTEFFGKIAVGYPGQTLNVAFDTTWIYTWVISSLCSDYKQMGCFWHNKYNHKKSSQYKPDGRKFSADLGVYNLTGFFSYDNISFAHTNVSNYSFIEIVDVPNSFVFNKADGVLGLGLKVNDYEPFFYTLLRQKKIRDPIYSVYLNRNRKASSAGDILLGFVDKSHINANLIDGKKVYDKILYMPVDALSYWQFTMDKIVMVHDPKRNDTFCQNGCKAIVDTSSSTIIGPVDEVAKIHKLINATKSYLNRYTVDCKRVNQLPTINFIIGGKSFELTGPQYISKITYLMIGYCVSNFQAAETVTEQSRWILGGSFLAEVYTIYDVDQKRIGLVKAA